MRAATVLGNAQYVLLRLFNAGMARRGTRMALALLVAAVTVLAVNIITASPALAACEPPGVPNAAGSGMPGFFDGATAAPSGDNYYGLYGYGGLRWNNCELGGPIAGNEWAGDPNAGLDTLIGNLLLGVATLLASISTALHKWIGNSTELLAPMDNLITQLSELTRTVIINNWFPVILLAGGALIFAAVISQNRRKALTTVVMSMVAVGIIGTLDTIPLKVAHSVDGIASNIQAETDTQALETAGITASKEEALGTLYVDTLIWPHWAAGATNSTAKPNPRSISDGSDQASFEDRIYTAGTTPFAETDKDADEQRDEFKDVASKMKSEQPEKFQALKGQSYNRTSNGFLAMVKVLPVAAFRIPAEGAIFLTLVIMRFVPIVGPVFAAFLIFPSTRALAFKHGRTLFSAVIHTIIVTFFASIHVAAVAFFFANLNAAFAIILTFVVTIVFFKWAKPLGALAQLMPAGSSVTNRISSHRRERRQDRRMEKFGRQQQATGTGDREGVTGHGNQRHGAEKRVGLMPAPRWRRTGETGQQAGQTTGQQHGHGHSRNGHKNAGGKVGPDSQNGRQVRPGKVGPESQNGRQVRSGKVGPERTGTNNAGGTRGTRRSAPPTQERYGANAPRVASTPANTESGTADRNAAGVNAQAEQITSRSPQRRGIDQERAAGATISDREAAARGYFVPPENRSRPARQETAGSQDGPKRGRVRIFVPPEQDARTESATAGKIGK